MDDLIRSGKVRYIGTSTYAAWQVVESIWVAKELGLNRFVCEQPPYHILDRRVERQLVPVAQQYGLAIIPWSPLAGGFLTGKYKRDAQRTKDSRYASPDWWGDRHFTDAVFDVVDVVEALSNEKGCTMAQFSLAWCGQQPGITSPIIGPRTMEQLVDNLGATDVTITESDREKIDEAIPPGRAVAHYYGPETNADWGAGMYR